MMNDLVTSYVNLNAPARGWLARQGVSTETMLSWPGPIGVATIEVHDLGIFDFSPVGQRAFVIPAYSGGIGSEVTDVLAWLPAAPARWSSHCYTGWPLGAHHLDHAEIRNEPIVLHPNPMAWLAAGGEGAVIIDWSMSGAALRSLTCIITDDIEFGREVQRRLTKPVQTCPEIRVRTERVAA